MFVRVPPHRGESRDAVAIVLLPPQSVSWSLWGFVGPGWGQRGAVENSYPARRRGSALSTRGETVREHSLSTERMALITSDCG